jgi:phage terminase large subunit GpA-like protein
MHRSLMPAADLLASTDDFATCWATFEPKQRLSFTDFVREFVVTDAGKPYDHMSYPQIGAVGGPGDAFDDHRIRQITLQWGVRLGKTFFGSCAILNTAAQDPAPMMLASSREKLSIDVTARLYEMIRRGPLSELLTHPENLQKRDLIEFDAARVYVAWARSPSSLADKNVRVGHANEIDKWDNPSTSTEGDPLDLFLDRFNDFLTNRKVIIEGTPSVKHRSRVERSRLNGTNCSMWVPCRACRRYQVLEFGSQNSRHGIKWDAGPDGRSDPEHAARTARYVCVHCGESCLSEDRPWMLRRGVWIPEGCGCDDAAALAAATAEVRPTWQGWRHASWITGTPARDGEEASYHLPTLYAMAIPTWGEFARRFLRVKARPQSLRAFINQWLAETWEATERKTTWEALGDRVIVDTPALELPPETMVVTAGIDKQLEHYVWAIDAWLPGESSHTIAYGTCKTLEELDAAVFDRVFPVQHSANSMRVKLALMDSGFRSSQVYSYCRDPRRRGRVLPAKGASQRLDTWVQQRKLGERTSSPGQPLVLVDVPATQDWLEESLATEGPGGWTLFRGSLAEHQDFLEQLLNDAAVGDVGPDGNYRERWERVDPLIPNDYRDCRRLAFGALKCLTKGARLRGKIVRQSPSTPAAGTLRITELP